MSTHWVLFLLFKRHRHAVHAIAQASRGWAVAEDVPEVGVANRATNFCAATIGFIVNGIGDNRGVKTGPARVRVELGPRHKKRIMTAYAGVYTLAVLMGKFAAVGPLGTAVTGNVIL